MSYQHFPAHAYSRMAWKNGGGTTAEIFRFPEHSELWDWRVSVAEVAADGPFSAFVGYQRSLTLLSGEGMRLQFADRLVELLPPHQSICFSGEENVSAELIDGATTDFNAIWRRDLFDIQVERRAMLGSQWFIREPNVCWFYYFLSGHGRIKSDPDSPQISAGDSIWLKPNESEQRLILEAHGEALCLKIIDTQPVI